MLKEVKALTHLRDYNTGGHQPMLILADDSNRYVAKPYRGTNFDYTIYNEILCNYLLGVWKIPTPNMALVNINKEVVANSKNASSYKKSSFDNHFFGSLYQENALELTQYLSFNKKVDYKKIVIPEKIVDLGLFDIWVENDDRKPSNYNILLYPEKERLKFLAIDNAFTFSNLEYKKLNPQFVCNSFNDNVLFSEFGKSILKKTSQQRNGFLIKKTYFIFILNNVRNNSMKLLATLLHFIR